MQPEFTVLTNIQPSVGVITEDGGVQTCSWRIEK